VSRALRQKEQPLEVDATAPGGCCCKGAKSTVARGSEQVPRRVRDNPPRFQRNLRPISLRIAEVGNSVTTRDNQTDCADRPLAANERRSTLGSGASNERPDDGGRIIADAFRSLRTKN